MAVADIMARDVEFILPHAMVAKTAIAMGDLSVGRCQWRVHEAVRAVAGPAIYPLDSLNFIYCMKN